MHRHLRPALLSLLLVSATVACREAPESHRSPVVQARTLNAQKPRTLALPNHQTSVKFAVIGDSGRGSPPQYEVAKQMMAFRDQFKYQFVLMVGDNIYEGPATPDDYRKKFEEPYRELLDDGVKFYAVLGNHDDPRQVSYPLFNMKGERYYSFSPPEDLLAKIVNRVEFFAIDSTNLDRTQLRWLDERLSASHADWKVCFFHHPLYTSGRYTTSSRFYRFLLEPLLVEHGVNVAFSGHEHIYQRTELQRGVQYFISGGAGSLRPGDGTKAPYIAQTFDSDYHFMLIEIDGHELSFQAISRAGTTIDAGTLYQDGHEARPADTTSRRQDTPALP